MEIERNDNHGYLLVRVSTAQSALPVEGARVAVSGSGKGNDGIYGVYYSDRSGNTDKIRLPAKPKADSETPGYAGEPFTRYNIRVEAEGYYPAEYVGAPVFEGITSVQQVNLIPTARYTKEPYGTNVYESAPDSFEGGE